MRTAVPSRPHVLVLLGCFASSNHSTGPNPSLLGMHAELEDRFEFAVLGEARGHDVPGRWRELWGVRQMPLEVAMLGARGLIAAVNNWPHDLVILNGFNDRVFTIPYLLARRSHLVPKRPVLLAPHGEFSPGALRLSPTRKRSWRQLAQAAGLLDGVTFQAFSSAELANIKNHFGERQRVILSPAIKSIPAPVERNERGDAVEEVRCVFLSRIDPMKNLNFLLEALCDAEVPASLDIWGPISDQQYWRACQRRIGALPTHLQVTYRGECPQEQVLTTLSEYDVMFLPTLGENFGHAIADALLAGTPVLISDRTPWRRLRERNAGWDLPLEQPATFAAALRELAVMPPEQRRAMRQGARQAAEDLLDPAGAAEAVARQLRELIAGAPAKERNMA